MNREYSLMYENYTNQYTIAQRQQNDPYARNNSRPPRTDGRNSTALTTSGLPGGGSGKQGPIGGGISIDNQEEMIDVKGVGKVTKVNAQKMALKIVDEVMNLTQKKQFTLVPAKLAMLDTIIKALQ